MCTTRTVPNVSLSRCICIECENCVSIQRPQLKYFRICNNTYCAYYCEEGITVGVQIIIWLFGTSLRHKEGVPWGNALAVYTKHGLSACISKQVMVGKVPRESRKMESLRFLTVVLSTILSGTVGNR